MYESCNKEQGKTLIYGWCFFQVIGERRATGSQTKPRLSCQKAEGCNSVSRPSFHPSKTTLLFYLLFSLFQFFVVLSLRVDLFDFLFL